jgi:hypothetical protein
MWRLGIPHGASSLALPPPPPPSQGPTGGKLGTQYWQPLRKQAGFGSLHQRPTPLGATQKRPLFFAPLPNSLSLISNPILPLQCPQDKECMHVTISSQFYGYELISCGAEVTAYGSV